MTMQTLASKIAKIEGKKSQARIGDIREILKIITQIMGEEMQHSIFEGDYIFKVNGAHHAMCKAATKHYIKSLPKVSKK